MGTGIGMKSVFSVYHQNEFIARHDIEHSDPKKQYHLGRATDNDVVVASFFVSSYHATILVENDRCRIRDNQSRNGTYVNGRRIQEALLQHGDMIQIGDIDSSSPDVVVISYTLEEEQGLEQWQALALGQPVISIGREKDNTIALSHNLISRHHARLVLTPQGYVLEDLNSTNGTFLNGQRISGSTHLTPNDVIQVAHTQLVFQAHQLVYKASLRGLKLDAMHITKVVKDATAGFFDKDKPDKVILSDISITIEPGELVAIIGGSGAGKSTFMDSINGFRLPTYGAVYINDDDFYQNYQAYKNIMGYVPQKDIVYDILTLGEMLTYAAKLRMPEDTTPEERQQRVAQVIHDVELTGRENLQIRKFSGGQRKRASIAVELLADPKLFYLDEPTSGLDPGMERNMMVMLKKLAKQGKTIVLITHATANIHLCDKVVILGSGGKLCYYGAPRDAFTFFGVDDYPEIYNLVTREADRWETAFKQSHYYSYVHDLMNKVPGQAPSEKPQSRSGLRQYVVLCMRYMKLTVTDRLRFFLLLLQAPLIAVIMGIVTERQAFENYLDAKSLCFLIAIIGVWLGVLNSIQEITKERNIYKRERSVNLKLTPYILSKLTILGMLAVIQSFLFVGVMTLYVDFPSLNLLGSVELELFITTTLSILAATALGLLVSSMVSNTDRAIGLTPVILIPQVVFSGLTFDLDGVAELISYLAVGKWAGRATAISVDYNNIPLASPNPNIPPPPRQMFDYYEHDLALLLQNWGILLFFMLVCIAINVVILKRQDTANEA